ncbi:hypothetical protein scyTo_0019438 [Scyliorhinus torazame]|uniref:Sec16 central conserved domain-containing protein n=1 Tax=Scyliorhinus torazame TaxID=75743 RepID=A0A401PZU5_SCYTO|nr:hypothetical protein [Scyliorhinus torazame]
MFFKGGEVENEETLVPEQQSGICATLGDAFQPSTGPFFSAPQLPDLCTGGVEPRGVGPRPPAPCGVYSQGGGDPAGTTDYTVPQGGGLVMEDEENSEFVQNQEVLPSESDRIPAGFQPVPGLVNPGLHSARNVGAGGGPPRTLATPDSAHHPLRSDSISSNHSSASHSSGSSLRRSQAQMSTFIQQESGKPPTDTPSRFFEQIDSSPLSRDPLHPGKEVESAGRPLYYSQLSQPPALSSPKPTATFQASANSSFEPVRSHGHLAIKAVEVDQAKMVMELNQSTVSAVGQRHGAGPLDISPGNLEQPPDNLENIHVPRPHSSLYPGTGTPEIMARPALEEPHKRPSSRVSGVWVKSESPAATLWAQSELPNFCAGIMLAPAAPAVPAAAKDPAVEVVQPPEDGGKGLNYPAPLGNMENPPQGTEDKVPKIQANPSYATLLVPTPASPTPPVLLARPLQTSPHLPSPERPLRDQGDGQSVAFATPVLLNPDLVTTAQGSVHDQAPLNLATDGRLNPRQVAEASTADPAAPTSPPSSRAPPAAVTTPASNLHPSADGSKDETQNQVFDQPSSSANCELLDFTLHRAPPPNQPVAGTNPAASLPLGAATQNPTPCHTYTTGLYTNDKPGFYLQVTTDVQQQQQQPIAAVTGQQALPPPPPAHDQSKRLVGQGCAEDPYSGRGGREGYASYYPDYYNGQYQYRDAAQWERYDPAAYDPRYRDYRDYDVPYWYYGAYQARDLYREVYTDSQIYRSQQDLTAEAPAQVANTEYTYEYAQSAVHPGYSDYQYRYPSETGWQPEEKAPAPLRPVTPEKFTIPHLCVRFSPGGQLLKVLPNLPSEGQPALVELHSLEVMLQHMPEQEELRRFPGPLVKEETHKVDVINFAQNKATECLRNDELLDKESANLLWELIVLLCRQNGTVIGTDIAELLLREHRSVWLPGKSPNEANLIDFNNDLIPRAEDETCTSLFTDSFLDSNSTESPGKDTERFRELLLFGRKKVKVR